MKIVLLEQELVYDGRQLCTSFVDEHAAGPDDAMVLFEGEADVPVERLVDLEDAEAGAFIYGPHMAHAIVEHRGMGLREAVLAQRLLVRIAATWISRRCGMPVAARGDDLFVGDGKLSVSVATTSPRGALIHLGINVRTEGTPVPTAGLADLRIRPRELLRALGRLYAEELAGIDHATGKVRPVE